jgi:hypothetical protein
VPNVAVQFFRGGMRRALQQATTRANINASSVIYHRCFSDAKHDALAYNAPPK